MADLSKSIALHDDPNSRKHADDKKGMAERRKTHYEPEPAIDRRPGGIVEGIFKSPVMGFCFRMKFGNARKMDGKKYTAGALEMSKQRAKYVRIRMRDGKARRDTGRYQHGAVSLITTIAPWQVGVVSKIGPHELEDLMLRLAETQAERIEQMSGRPVFGGGAHLDTDLPHWHLHIPKTDEKGNVFPKATFLTAGKWTAGADRVNRKFPGLLTNYKREMLDKAIARKRRENLVDLACNEAIDKALESWIRDRGYWADYERDCAEYAKRKTKAQAEEPLKRLMQASLGHHSRTGIWPLAWQCMSFGMWRMIPRELRPAITLSIRAYQIVRRPTKLIKMAPRVLMDLAREPQITLPIR